MLTWFFTSFGIGIGIAVLIILLAFAYLIVWFVYKLVQTFISSAREGIQQGIEEDRARQARKAEKQQQG